jgi:histidinol-phosphate aminotransferase
VLGLSDYEPGRSVQEVARDYGLCERDIVKLASNENPFGPSPDVLQAVEREGERFYMYPWQEFTDLRNQVADANGLPPSQVVLASGSESVVQMIPRLYVEPGDEVIAPVQTYSRYAQCSLAMGGRVRWVPLADYRFDLEAVADAITARTKIVWLCSPNNPTGTILKADETEDFLAAVPERVAIVVDQAYCEFVDDPDYADAVRFVREGWPNVIVLRTFSKAFALAGLRLGYALADGVVCRMLDRIEEPFFLNRAAIAAGSASLRNMAWVRRSVAAIKAERARVGQRLAALGFGVVPSQANFILVDVRRPAREVFEELLALGVIVRPADGWGYPNHLRVTIGRPEQNDRFLEAISEVTGSLAS